MRDNNEGTYRGREGTTPVTTGGEKGRRLWPPRRVQKIAEVKTSYELSWKVKAMIFKEKLMLGGSQKYNGWPRYHSIPEYGNVCVEY